MNRITTRLALASAAATLIAVPAAKADSVAVTAGSVDWNQTAVYNASPERTWLGHVTNPAVGSGSNGSATPSDGATLFNPDGTTGTSVVGTSPRGVGAQYAFRFKAASGTIDRAARALDVTTTGKVTYVQYPWLGAGAPKPIALSGLRLTLSGNTGALYAAFTGTNADATYPTGGKVFNLNAAQAQYVDLGNGRTLVSNLVPTIATADIFGSAGQYPVGTSGPDRTPNNWGGFSVVVDTQAATPTPDPVTIEKIVEKTVTTTTTVTVDKTSDVIKATLSKKAFGTSSTLDITIRKAGDKTVLGEGYVTGTKLVVILPKGTTLAGKYTLTRTSGSKKLAKTATVTVATKSAKTKSTK